MSPNVVQRGDLAIYDKWQRTNAALLGGADLVIELPAPFACSSANRFAFGAVSIANAMGCADILSFGSENGDVLKLQNLANMEFDISAELSLGKSYPRAIAESAGADLLPNDILGIEYIRRINKLGSDIKPIVVKRFGADHDGKSSHTGFASASEIRKEILDNKSVEEYLNFEYQNPTDYSKLDSLIVNAVRNISNEEFETLIDITEGLENRIKKAAITATSYCELLEGAKTKRYTMAKIRRSIFAVLLNLTPDLYNEIPYLRILGANKSGLEVLSKMKDTASIPFSTSLAKLAKTSPLAEKFAKTEVRATDLFATAQEKILPGDIEYVKNAIIL